MKEAIKEIFLLKLQSSEDKTSPETLPNPNNKHALTRRAYHQQQESMINYWNLTYYYTSEMPMKREYWRVFNKIYTENSNIKWNRPTDNSVIMLFANRTKSLKNQNLLYLQGLNNSKN